MRVFSAIILAGIVSGTLTAQINHRSKAEQTAFSAEDEEVKKPVAVPDDVLSLLIADDLVREAMEDSEPPVKVPPQGWFSASRIHLGATEEEDLIIEARGPLVGANIDTFWIILRTPKRPVLVLTASAHDLMVKKSRSNGYRDIELFSATAVECSTTVLKFDGKKYNVSRLKSGPIPHC
ncbi:MAG TPA: hypothetical protein VGJ21_08365 [Terracidiphilus sp.]|jgi:hypothetical protein